MRNLKRALSLALATVMTMGLMVVGSSASYSDVVATDNVEAIEVAQAVGVMVGDDNGNFNPTQQVTRAEMATVMANLLGLNVDSFKGASLSFTDVPDWAVPYVAACAADGIVSGYSSTNFGSNDTVTAAQAGLMVLKALGYFQNANDFGSDWQLSTIKQADKAGLYDGITASATDALTRNDVAQLVLNALEATMVEVDGNSGVTISGNGFTISNGSTQYTDVLNADTKYSKIDKTKDGSKYTVELGEDLFDGKLVKSASSTRDDLGRPGTKWTYKGEEIGTYGDEADYVVVLSDKYTDKDSVLDILKDDDVLDDDDLKTTSTKYVLNGDTDATEADVVDASTYGTVYEVYMDEDNDDLVTDVIAYYYTLDQIDTVDDDVTSSDAKKGITSYVTFADAGKFDDDKIVGFNANTYVEDAYVAVVVNGDKVIASAVADEVEGSVTTKKDGTNGAGISLTISGTKYRTNVAYTVGNVTKSYSDISTDSDDSYVLYLDPNGYVIGADGVKGTTDLKDVYYVDSVWVESTTVTGGSPKDYYYAQIVNVTDGTFSEIQLEEVTRNPNGSYAKGSKYVTSGTNTSPWTGKLVTISDKKWTNGNTTYKASNDKYDLELWSDSDYAVNSYGSVDNKVSIDLSKSDVRMTLGSKTYRLNSSTVYLFLEDSGDNLDTTRYVGGVRYNKDVNKVIVITEDDSSVVKYVLFQTGDADQDAEYSEDMIYIKSDDASEGSGFYTQTVYYVDGGSIVSEDWKIDDGEYTNGKLPDGVGFYTYDTNSDGYYVLEKADPMTIKVDGGAYNWDDEEGVLEDALFISDDDLYNDTLLSLYVTITDDSGNEQTVKYTDIETKGAAFKDVRSSSLRNKDNQYSTVVSSLSRLATVVKNNTKDSTHAEAKLQLNVSEDGAVMIVLTDLQINVPNT
jgi:hypothetical protein